MCVFDTAERSSLGIFGEFELFAHGPFPRLQDLDRSPDFGVKVKDVHYPLFARPIRWTSAASATMQSLRCVRVLARSLPAAQSTSALLRPSAHRVSSPQTYVLFVLDPLHKRVS